jgi:putative PIG3 family NAD(P)H quinone oxidoreductase
MKAIHVESDEPGGHLVWRETTDPVPGPGEVLVDVYAAALNRADLLQRAGGYPAPPGVSTVLGLDSAGQVAQLGEGVAGPEVGERVCALLAGGGYAERAVVPVGMLMPIPGGWSFEEAAALPEAYLTAFTNLFLEAEFQPGETLLVHGGASGVGTALIQLAKAAGGRVIATAGSAEKTALCRALGADLAVNYREEDFVARTRTFSAENGGDANASVNVIIDMVGAEYFQRNLGLLGTRGRMVSIATLSGAKVELNLGELMSRRLRLIGSVLRARSLAEKVQITRRFRERFWPMLEAGKIRPVIDSVYPIEKVEDAHRRMAANLNLGKIVLRIR